MSEVFNASDSIRLDDQVQPVEEVQVQTFDTEEAATAYIQSLPEDQRAGKIIGISATIPNVFLVLDKTDVVQE